jgi:hypothetical protein
MNPISFAASHKEEEVVVQAEMRGDLTINLIE